MVLEINGIRSAGRGLLAALLAVGLVGAAANAGAQDLDELVTQVGEAYTVSYASPLLYSFGPNANSNMYTTARIPWGRFVFGVGIKVMGTHLSEEDQTFTKAVNDVDLGQYDPAYTGQTGDILFSGPTVFGDPDTPGRIQGFFNGVEVFNQEGIPGLVESRWSPLVAPEIYFGGLYGLKATVRYLPAIEVGDLGETKYLGYGLQWSANGLLPTLPVDVMAGFFTQEINVGSIFESSAHSLFVAASKSFTMLTVYGGVASEDSSIDVAYEFVDPNDANNTADIAFTVDGIQTTRLTLGVTLDILAKLNFEAGFGNKMTTYSAGLMFGL